MGQVALCQCLEHRARREEVDPTVVAQIEVDTSYTGWPRSLQNGPLHTARSSTSASDLAALLSASLHRECCSDTYGEGEVVEIPVVDFGSALQPAQGLPRLDRHLLGLPWPGQRFEDSYELGKQIGEGSFGNVCEAFFRVAESSSKVAGRCLAVKVFPMGTGMQNAELSVRSEEVEEPASRSERTGSKEPARSEKSGSKAPAKSGTFTSPSPRPGKMGKDKDMKRRESFNTEREILARLDHPSIVRMYECFEEPLSLNLVLEHCHGGELYTYLVSHVKEKGGAMALGEVVTKELFRQMLRAVAYLHAKRIVHRDLKTENFLLLGKRGGPQEHILKLCDFGTAVQLSDAMPRSHGNIGTLSYTAPEVYMNLGADTPADAWSLGVVLYVLVTGSSPFRLSSKATREDTVRRIRSGEYYQKRPAWTALSAEGKDLVAQLLVLDESGRLTCLEALSHSWLTSPRTPSSLRDIQCWSPRMPEVEFVWLTGKLLVQYPALSWQQRLTLGCVAAAVTEEDIEQMSNWRELFLAFDINSDGTISPSEFTSGLRSCLQLDTSSTVEVSESQLADLFEAVDLDHSGRIEWAEWLAVGVLTIPEASEDSPLVQATWHMLQTSDQVATTPELLECQRQKEWIAQSIRDFAIRSSPVDQEFLLTSRSSPRGAPLTPQDLALVLKTCKARINI